MTRLLRPLLALALFAGCGSPVIAPDASSDVVPLPTDRTITFLTSGPLQLEPGARAAIAVALRDDRTGQPLSSENVHFALVRGDARDATLSDTTVGTGTGSDAGVARTTLLASSGAATFWIRASADRASDIYIFVGVSARGFGSVAITALYGGQRQPQTLTVDVFDGVDCAHLATAEPVGTATIPAAGGMATFGSLPAGEPFAIRGTAVATAGLVVASGCIDQVVFTHDETARRGIPFIDRPLQPDGTYDVRFQLDLGSLPLFASTAWTSAVSAEISHHGTEADYLLDAIATSVGLPHTPARDSFDGARDMLRASINALYSTSGASPLQSLLRLGADTARSASSVTIDAVATTRADRTAFDLSGGTIVLDPLTPDVMSDDLSSSIAIAGSGRIAVSLQDRAAGSIQSLTLPFPSVARAASSALLARLGAGSTAEWARLSARCSDVAAAVSPVTGSACGTDCITTACNGAVNQLAAVFDASLGNQGSQHAAVNLLFEGRVAGVPSTLRIDQIGMAPLAGAFVDDPTLTVLGTVQFSLHPPR